MVSTLITLSHLESENLPLSQWSENVEIKGLEVLILSFNFSFFEIIPNGKIITFEISSYWKTTNTLDREWVGI